MVLLVFSRRNGVNNTMLRIQVELDWSLAWSSDREAVRIGRRPCVRHRPPPALVAEQDQPGV